MQLLICKDNQTSYVNDCIECIFNNGELRVYFNGELNKTYPAKIGDTFYVYASGKSKSPRVKKDDVKDRGERIARALSFSSKQQYAASEREFLETFHKLSDGGYISNAYVYQQIGDFAILIADYTYQSEKAKAQGIPAKIKLRNPVLAWINPEICDQDLKDLIDFYEKVKPLPCPRGFILAQ